MARRRKKQGPKMAPDDPRRKNLRPPIKPGEVLNPLGKNGSEWLARIRAFAEEIDPNDRPRRGGAKRDRFARLMEAGYKKALKGGDVPWKVIVEQLAGRPRQHIEVSGNASNGPLVTFLLPENGRDVAPPEAPAAEGEPKPNGDPTADE